MFFENLNVDRIIIHEVHRRLDDKQPISPTYGQQMLTLGDEAMGFFRERVVAAMGSNSQSMVMSISPPQPGCALECARDLLTHPQSDFVANSRRFPDKLTAVQTARNIPGGVIMVFTGTAGNPSRPIIGIVKAETHSGFRHTSTLQVQYLKDLFMGPQTKLFKIGVFLHDGISSLADLKAGWDAIVYDRQMTPKNRDAAANYFYERFLGCTLPANSAHLTKRFFEETRAFINAIDASDERKSDLFTGLYTYLKVDQSATVEISKFSSQYLSPDLKDDYEQFMSSKSFPTTAISKDNSDIQSYLRKRRLRFTRDIQFIAPPDAFADLVQVKSIKGDADTSGGTPIWTQITIRDRVRDQE